MQSHCLPWMLVAMVEEVSDLPAVSESHGLGVTCAGGVQVDTIQYIIVLVLNTSSENIKITA